MNTADARRLDRAQHLRPPATAPTGSVPAGWTPRGSEHAGHRLQPRGEQPGDGLLRRRAGAGGPGGDDEDAAAHGGQQEHAGPRPTGSPTTRSSSSRASATRSPPRSSRSTAKTRGIGHGDDARDELGAAPHDRPDHGEDAAGRGPPVRVGRLGPRARHARRASRPSACRSTARPSPSRSRRASATAKRIALTGRGFSQGSGSTAWSSFASVLRARRPVRHALGLRARTRPAAARTPRPSAPVTCSTSGRAARASWLWFGLSSYANWAKIGTNVVPYVDFDTTGDGEPDYETYVTYLPGTDVLVAETYDLNDPDSTTVDVQPVNFNYGDVDTNVFDTNVLTLPVSKKLVGLNERTGTDHLHGRDLRPVRRRGHRRQRRRSASTPGSRRCSTAKPAVRRPGRRRRSTTRPRDRHPVEALVLHLHGADERSGPRCSRCPRSAPSYAPVR